MNHDVMGLSWCGVLVCVTASWAAATLPPAREHMASWQHCYIGRDIPGLIAPQWTGEQHIGQVAVIDLTRVRDDTARVRQVITRFNLGELNDFVIQLPSPLTVPYAVIDLNRDGHLDRLLGSEEERSTLVWSPQKNDWLRSDLPTSLGLIGGRIAFVSEDGAPSLIIRSIAQSGGWHFVDGRWQADVSLINGMDIDGTRVLTSAGGRDRGVRFRDLNHDGRDELIVANDRQQAVMQWSPSVRAWQMSSLHWPAGVLITTSDARDSGVRFGDVNGDDQEDLLVSNDAGSAVYLCGGKDDGFGPPLLQTSPDDDVDMPAFVIDGRPTGAWFDEQTGSVLGADDDREEGPTLSWNRAIRFAAAFADVVAGFDRLVHNDGGQDVWWDYRGQKSPNHFLRQQHKGTRLSWQTAAAPTSIEQDQITFFFVGGMGYRSEPETEGFALTINDDVSVRFDLTREKQSWTDDDQQATLVFEPTWQSSSDAAGWFRLTVDRRLLMPGKPLTLTVTSRGEGSNRWFAIHPITHPTPANAVDANP